MWYWGLFITIGSLVLLVAVFILIIFLVNDHLCATYCCSATEALSLEAIPSYFDIYPPNTEIPPDFNTKGKRLLVASLLRNAEQSFGYIEEKMAMFHTMFSKVTFIILENNSKDRTRERLVQLSRKYDIVLPEFQRYDLLENLPTVTTGKSIGRIMRMAVLRNELLETVRQHQDQYDYLFITDLDVKGKLYANGVRDTMWQFENKDHIQAIGCHAVLHRGTPFFDVYAVELVRQKDNRYVRRIAKEWHFIKQTFAKNKPMERVVSTFSGGVFYRAPLPKEACYEPLPMEGDPERSLCEHIAFHRHFDQVYINHRMIYFMSSHS